MSTNWETFYIVKAPSQTPLQSPLPTNPDDKPPSYHYNKNGVERINFTLPGNYVFFEQRTANGCPTVLKIHLLGHEGCIEHFLKYSETVESIEFHGCLEYLENGFKICSLMNKLKDVRFYFGRIPIQIKSPVKSQSWNSSGIMGNTKVVSLRIMTDLAQYHKLSTDHKNNMIEFIEMTMEYSLKQFQSVHELRLELPDSDRFLSFTRELLKLPKMPKHPRIEMILDQRIYSKVEATAHPQAPKRSSSLLITSSPDADSHEASPKEDPNPEKKLPSSDKSSMKVEAKAVPESVPTQSITVNEPPKPPPSNYSYEMSTAQRLLQESSAPLSSAPAVTVVMDKRTNNKRPGDPLVNPNEYKRPYMQNRDEVSRKHSSSNEPTEADGWTESESTRSQDDERNVSKCDKEQSKERDLSKSPSATSSHHEPSRSPRDRQSGSDRNFDNCYYRREDFKKGRTPEDQEEHQNRREARPFPFRGSRGNYRGRGNRGNRPPRRPNQDRNRSNYDAKR